MRTIAICDRTIQEAAARSERPASFKEKLEIARILSDLQVDVIETGALVDDAADTVLLRSLAALAGDSVLSCPAGTTEAEMEAVYAAIRGAKHPRLLVKVPVSTVGMEYTYHKKPEKALEAAAALVRKGVALGAEVEFAADDATRAELPFLYRALNAAVENGASVVSLCDTAGVMLPSEFAAFLRGVRENVPGLEKVRLGVRCCNTLHMATACTFEAIGAGADEIGTATGFSQALSLKSVAQAFRTRGDSLGVGCRLKMTELLRAVRKLQEMAEPASSGMPSAGGFAGAESIQLSQGADLAHVRAAVRRLGYELTDDDVLKVYDAFSRNRKEQTGAKELDAIVATVSMQVPPTYRLDSYVVNSGNIISATANLTLEREGERLQGLSCGNGPIDAAFLAIEQIIGYRYELDDFQIQSVTEGREAMGQALVKLRYDGMLYGGCGVSSDIISASILAYLNALNKIVYERNRA